MMGRYRWTVAPTHTRRGAWFDTPKEAREDALEAGLAHRDEEHPGPIFLDELVEIEEER
jgi:hypothetical protein